MKMSNIKVVALDLDGVLFDGPSAVFPLARWLGLERRFLEVMEQGRRENLSLKDTIIKGARIWDGVPTDGTLDPLINEIPLMKGAEETVYQLKKWGYRVGCISSGVSQFFMKPFKARLKLDFAYSNILGESDGAHDGTVHYIMLGPEKAEKAKEYLDMNDFSRTNMMSVGDGENDIEMFDLSSFSIAFNPESEKVSKAATLTLHTKDLRDILKYVQPD